MQDCSLPWGVAGEGWSLPGSRCDRVGPEARDPEELLRCSQCTESPGPEEGKAVCLAGPVSLQPVLPLLLCRQDFPRPRQP